MQNIESRFNWKLPLYSCLGFAAGFIIGYAAWSIIGSSVGGLVVMGAVTGAFGGSAFGLALKNKDNVLYLSCAGAVGFAAGLSIWIALMSYTGSGALIGAIMGAFGGSAFGLALKNKRNVLYLSCAGALGFALGFAIADAITVEIASDYLREVVGFATTGAVGGLIIGAAGSVIEDIN